MMFDNRRNSFSFVLLVTYLAILLLPLFACAFIYNSSTNLIEERFDNYDSLFAREMMHEIDDLLKNYTMVKNRLLQSSALHQLCADNGAESQLEEVFISTLSQEIMRCQREIHSTGNISVYFPQKSLFLTSNGRFDGIDEFVGKFSYHPTIRNSLIYSGQTEYHQLTNEDSLSRLVYQTPLVTMDNGATVKLVIDENTDILIQNINALRGNLLLEYMIFDREGTRVLSSPAFLSVNHSEVIAEYHRNGYFTFQNHKYNVLTITSLETDLQYLLVMSDKVMNYRMAAYRVVSLLCIVLAAVVGTLLILMFIRQNKKSITSILDMLSPVYQPDGEGNENEVYRIKETIKSLMNEQNSFRNKLTSVSQKLEKEYLTNLITGRSVNKDGKKELAESLPFDFSRGGFRQYHSCL